MRFVLRHSLVLAAALPALWVGGAVFGSVGGAPAAPAAAAPVRHDFGEVSPLDTPQVEHRFRFKNTGGTPLKIERLSSTCGCTSTIVGASGTDAAYPTLAPGEETTIHVTVNLVPLRPGALRKSVAVFAEGVAQPVALYELAFTLLPTVAFSPPLVDFGSVPAGEARSVPLTVTLDPRLTASGPLPPLVASHPALRIQPSPPESAARTSPSSKTVVRTYTVSVAPDAPLGAFTASLAFAPGGAQALLRSSVFVVGQVAGAVSAQPQALAFGGVVSGQSATREVVLRGTSAQALKNRKVSSASPWLRIAPAPPAGEPAQPLSETIAVVLRPDAPTGVLQTHLTVTLENGQRLLLPVSAYVTAPAGKP